MALLYKKTDTEVSIELSYTHRRRYVVIEFSVISPMKKKKDQGTGGTEDTGADRQSDFFFFAVELNLKPWKEEADA